MNLYTPVKMVMPINHKVELIVMDQKRITAGSVLILILLGLCLYYHDYHEDNLKYPSTAAILSDYPEGSQVFVSGSVIKPNKNGFYLRDGGKIDIVYNVISSEHVQPDDYVQVLGILEHNYTIESNITYVETKWGYEFIILRSGLALIIFIFIFFRYWKFNFRTLELIRRR